MIISTEISHTSLPTISQQKKGNKETNTKPYNLDKKINLLDYLSGTSQGSIEKILLAKSSNPKKLEYEINIKLYVILKTKTQELIKHYDTNQNKLGTSLLKSIFPDSSLPQFIEKNQNDIINNLIDLYNKFKKIELKTIPGYSDHAINKNLSTDNLLSIPYASTK